MKCASVLESSESGRIEDDSEDDLGSDMEEENL
jgi:hypothetical protein